MTTLSVRELRTAADRIRGTVQLREVYTTAVEFETSMPLVELPLTTTVSVYVQGAQHDDDLEAWATYHVVASAADGRSAWQAMLKCLAVFESREKQPLAHSASDVAAFALYTGPPLLHPYAREVVQSLTARSAYPAFTMGLLTPVSEHPDDMVFELALPTGQQATQ